MSSEICLDANVFVSAFDRKEVHHPLSARLLDKIEERRLFLWEPEVVLFEVGTALHTKKARGELTPKEVDDLLDLFFDFPVLLKWQSDFMKRAMQIASELSLKGLADPFYLAIAEARKIPFVTWDQELAKKGAKIIRKIYTPDEFLKLPS